MITTDALTPDKAARALRLHNAILAGLRKQWRISARNSARLEKFEAILPASALHALEMADEKVLLAQFGVVGRLKKSLGRLIIREMKFTRPDDFLDDMGPEEIPQPAMTIGSTLWVVVLDNCHRELRCGDLLRVDLPVVAVPV